MFFGSINNVSQPCSPSSLLVSRTLCLLQPRPASLLLRLLLVLPQASTVDADFGLQLRDDVDFVSELFTAEAISFADPAGDHHELGVPLVALEAGLQVVVFLLLEQVVVMAAQGEVAIRVATSVFTDAVNHVANGFFVLGDQLGVFDLLVLVEADEVLLGGELVLEVADAQVCVGWKWLIEWSGGVGQVTGM